MTGRFARYLLKETLWMYVLGVTAFCILLSIDFLSVWAKWFLRQDVGLTGVAQMMLFKLPYFLHLSLPIAIVFAVLIATGRLAKDSELKAAYASGIPPLLLLMPLIFFGLVVSLLSLYNNGFLEPRANTAYDRLYNSFYQSRPPDETQYDVSFRIQSEGIYFAGRIKANQGDVDQAELRGVLVLRDDGSMLTAAMGIWDSQQQLWLLEDVEIITANSQSQKLESFELPFALNTSASEAVTDEDELTLSQAWLQVQSGNLAGSNNRALRFDFHRRLADAVSSAVFVLVAGALGLYLHGRAAGFAWTIVLLVLFYFLWVVSGELFERGVLSPIAAAWFTPAAVASLGSVLALTRLR